MVGVWSHCVIPVKGAVNTYRITVRLDHGRGEINNFSWITHTKLEADWLTATQLAERGDELHERFCIVESAVTWRGVAVLVRRLSQASSLHQHSKMSAERAFHAESPM
mgnify:CR=1 FL=1